VCFQCQTVALQTVPARSILQGSVGNQADAPVPEADEVFRGHAGCAHVVHVDEVEVYFVQLTQENDGDSFLGKSG